MRLLPQHHDGRSIAAVAVAAHEVSHAVQHARGEPAFARRFDLVSKLVWVERVAIGILLLTPLVFIAGQVAGAGRAADRGRRRCCWRSASWCTSSTLPVEFDASFGKALPVLTRGRYLAAGDLPAARSVLQAAAFTYVAAALATLLDVAALVSVILRFRHFARPAAAIRRDRATDRPEDNEMISRRTLLGTIAAAPLASAFPRAALRRLSGQAGARDRAVRGRRQCGLRRAARAARA